MLRAKTIKTIRWSVDPELNYLQVDAAKERLLEVPIGALVGVPLIQCMHPNDALMLRSAIALGSGGRALTNCSIRYVCPKGTHTITSLNITPTYNAQADLMGFEGEEFCIGSVEMHNDIPPVFEAVFARGFMAHCIIDRDARLLAVNEQYSRVTGKPTNALIHTSVYETGIPSTEEVAGAFSTLDAGGLIPEQEIIRGGKDYVMSIVGLPDACGDIRSICVSLRDISLRKGLERRLEAANRQLEEMNLKDYLTGVFNRRHFDEALQKEMALLAREGGEMCVGMVDVDHFKLFNDAYGHLAGDACLAGVAKAMGTALYRPGDELFRYGGEEFAIIMPHTDKKGATSVAERVREAVCSLRIPHCHYAPGYVTVSIGVAVISSTNARFGCAACEELIRVADKALYAAKNSGRNKVATGNCTIGEREEDDTTKPRRNTSGA